MGERASSSSRSGAGFSLAASPASYGWELDDIPLQIQPTELVDLCTLCQDTIDHWLPISSNMDRHVSADLPYYESFSALKVSADQGCKLCIQFVRDGEAQEAYPYEDPNLLSYRSRGSFDRIVGTIKYLRRNEEPFHCWRMGCSVDNGSRPNGLSCSVFLVPITKQGKSISTALEAWFDIDSVNNDTRISLQIRDNIEYVEHPKFTGPL